MTTISTPEARIALLDHEVTAINSRFAELKAEVREGCDATRRAIDKLATSRGFTLTHAALALTLAGAVGGYVSWFTATTLTPINMQLNEIRKTLDTNSLDVMAYRLTELERRLGQPTAMNTPSASPATRNARRSQ